MLLSTAGRLAFSQTDSLAAGAKTDTLPKKDSSGFDKFNAKAEALFKIIPVPTIGYTQEAGTIVGLAKFNLINLSKKDTISRPSKLSEVVNFSTKGRINASVSTELLFHQNKYMVISFINYKRQPEYLFGIGNDVVRDSVEEVRYDRIQFVASGLVLIRPKIYAGISWDISNYFEVQADSNSFLIRKNDPGLAGGWCIGVGGALVYENRDNRYNPYHGAFIFTNYVFYTKALGSAYEFSKFNLDVRKYFNPWLKHVIALQATTTYCSGDVPFFQLALMGGDNKMRGYYLGAYRDNVLLDGQMEYRFPIWNIFGATTWIATGQVGPNYGALSLNGFHVSYGVGIRIRVDTKHNTNMRFDMGFGPDQIKGFYINFSEAF